MRSFSVLASVIGLSLGLAGTAVASWGWRTAEVIRITRAGDNTFERAEKR